MVFARRARLLYLEVRGEGSDDLKPEKNYVANGASNDVSVIATARNTVTAAITTGTGPIAFGVFIIRPSFAGTQGLSNCHG